MRIYMQTPGSSEQASRFYQLCLERDLLQGWILVKEWGAVGAGGRVQREHFEDFQSAEDALIENRDRQLKKGYRVMYVQGQMEPR